MAIALMERCHSACDVAVWLAYGRQPGQMQAVVLRLRYRRIGRFRRWARKFMLPAPQASALACPARSTDVALAVDCISAPGKNRS